MCRDVENTCIGRVGYQDAVSLFEGNRRPFCVV